MSLPPPAPRPCVTLLCAGPDWHALAHCRLTLVVHRGVARADEVARALLAAGMDPGTPAAAISAAFTPRQRHALCTLDRLVQTVREEGPASPSVLVIGEVAAHGSPGLQNPVPALAVGA